MNDIHLSTPEEVIATALDDLAISLKHSEECLIETRYWLANPGLDDPALEDLTGLPFVTIDNPDSRDLDQALLLERLDDGYRVQYALADASYYIRPGSALFTEALARGTTFYTPLMAAAMLPTDLSEGLISLNPNVNRRALIFDMNLDGRGTTINTTVRRAVIRSQAKLSYGGVQQWLDNPSDSKRAYDDSLKLLQEIGKLLISASAKRGVVAFDRTETRVEVLDEPRRFHATVRKRYATERYNEQISLLCNMQGAALLVHLERIAESLQSVFRVHQAPLNKSLTQLKTTLAAFAKQQDNPEHWLWHSDQNLADYLDSLPDDARYARRVGAVQRQIMQAQRASTFQSDSAEHHALKADSYARFSSPMREVVGIFTHKELLEALDEDRSDPVQDNARDEALREVVIASANEAKQKQRQLDKRIEFAVLSSLFAHDLTTSRRKSFTGTIMGMRSERLYISLDTMALDVKVYGDCLERQFATTYTMTDVSAMPADLSQPVWQLGHAVTINLQGYDKERKRFLFHLTCAEDDSQIIRTPG